MLVDFCDFQFIISLSIFCFKFWNFANEFFDWYSIDCYPWRYQSGGSFLKWRHLRYANNYIFRLWHLQTKCRLQTQGIADLPYHWWWDPWPSLFSLDTITIRINAIGYMLILDHTPGKHLVVKWRIGNINDEDNSWLDRGIRAQYIIWMASLQTLSLTRYLR